MLSNPNSYLEEYVEDILHVMLSSHVAYMTSWNDAAITDLLMLITKANLAIPISTKNLLVIQGCFQCIETICKWVSGNCAIYLGVGGGCNCACMRSMCKGYCKGKRPCWRWRSFNEVCNPTGQISTSHYPPLDSSHHTESPEELPKVGAQSLLQWIQFAVTFKILSILSHQLKVVMQMAAGAIICRELHLELMKYISGYKFPDRLPDPKVMEELEEIAVRDRQRDCSW